MHRRNGVKQAPLFRQLPVKCDPHTTDALQGYTLFPELPITASHRLQPRLNASSMEEECPQSSWQSQLSRSLRPRLVLLSECLQPASLPVWGTHPTELVSL